MKRIIIPVLFMSLLFVRCGSDDSEQIAKEEALLDSIMNQTANAHHTLADEVVEDIIASIPSPLEMASIIKTSGAPYNLKMLNQPDMVGNYNSIYTKAFNLGVYGTDMGYINLHEKTADVFGYLKAIKGLADDLKVGHFFDLGTLKRLTDNSSNMDSLLYISTTGFAKMDNYLKENNRGNISMLILVGGWFESLYISTEVISSSKMDYQSELATKIGEQKIVLDDIFLLLSAYDKDPNTKDIKEKFTGLKAIYDKVSIIYKYAEPETKEVDGMLVIVDNSTSEVEITQELLDALVVEVKKVRNELILKK